MKKKILILGSEGQIGGHLVEFLKNKNKYEIIKFDIVLGKKFDIRNYKNSLLEKNIKKSDFVFFLAFDVGGSRYLKKYQNSYKFMINNLLIMNNSFQLLKKYKKKFVFASSQMSNMDFTPYGTLKRLGESITKSLNSVYVKFWNVYGIEKDLDKSHVITDFILKALKNRKIRMLTNGMESREFLFASDCSEGLYAVMKRFKFFSKSNEELHLTTGKRIKIINIAKIIQKIFFKRKIKIKIIPSLKIDSLQKNKNNKPNNFILKYWKPKTEIKDGIEKILDFYLMKKS